MKAKSAEATIRHPSHSSSAGATAKLQKTMRAVAIDRFGGPEVLTLHTLQVPALSEHEVLIGVNTAGVGVWDAQIRDGTLDPSAKKRFPLVLGTDGSGVIAELGSRVRRFKVGDRVYSYAYDNPKADFTPNTLPFPPIWFRTYRSRLTWSTPARFLLLALPRCRVSMTRFISRMAKTSSFTVRAAAWEVSLYSSQSCAGRGF